MLKVVSVINGINNYEINRFFTKDDIDVSYQDIESNPEMTVIKHVLKPEAQSVFDKFDVKMAIDSDFVKTTIRPISGVEHHNDVHMESSISSFNTMLSAHAKKQTKLFYAELHNLASCGFSMNCFVNNQLSEHEQSLIDFCTDEICDIEEQIIELQKKKQNYVNASKAVKQKRMIALCEETLSKEDYKILLSNIESLTA
ncbi:hypothetical protein [Photobacterium damselae]|uniref:hypothetical protein n=1 Tax=Photobacterium damselae TaxID=38293 RepID=UPI00406959B7